MNATVHPSPFAHPPPLSDGLDFYFPTESGARKLVEFLQTMVPCRVQQSKRLVSHDDHSNVYNYKHTHSVEVVPVCKDNVVCLPKRLAHSLGGMGQVCVAHKVSNLVHLIDPTTCQGEECVILLCLFLYCMVN